MKHSYKFNDWIDRSIERLITLKDEIELINPGESKPKLSEVPKVPTSPPHAEASDFLSINEWLLMP